MAGAAALATGAAAGLAEEEAAAGAEEADALMDLNYNDIPIMEAADNFYQKHLMSIAAILAM